MNPKLLATLDKHAAATFDKQDYLQELIQGLPWEFDLETGLLGFGNRYQWRTQVLGTQSVETATWLWGWANEKSGVPPQLLADVNTLRKLGADKGIPEFCQPKLSADSVNGDDWSIIATGLLRAQAYYCGTYDGGGIFLLIKDPKYPRNPKLDHPLARLAAIFPQAVAQWQINDHRLALVGHAESLGLSVERQGNDFVIASDRGQKMIARFNQQHKITNLEGTIS